MSWIFRCAFCYEKIIVGKTPYKFDMNPLTEERERVCMDCYQTFIADVDDYL